jgi:RHS repeat-associated protein
MIFSLSRRSPCSGRRTPPCLGGVFLFCVLAGLACGRKQPSGPRPKPEVGRVEQPVVVVPTPQALLVVGATPSPLPAGDAALQTRLATNLGYAVTVVTGTNVTAAMAAGKTVVVISESVTDPATGTTGAQVGTKLKTVTVPVVVLEPFLFDDMGMTLATNNTDFGLSSATQTTVAITSAGHAMAAGLTGTVTFAATPAQKIGWGKPGTGAEKVASVPGVAAQTTIFGYITGAAMASGTATGRRVGWFAPAASVALFNANGWALLEAAIKWAALPEALLVTGAGTATTAETALKTHLQAAPFNLVVRTMASTAVTTTNMLPAQFIVISDALTTANAQTLGTTLNAAAVPLLSLSAATFGNLRLTGTTSGTDFGTTGAQTQIAIANAGHPLAAGLTGTVAIPSETVQWGNTVAAGAIKVATLTSANSPPRYTIFGFGNGATLRTGTAPARRVGLFASSTSLAAAATTAAIWRLFDAAVTWVKSQSLDAFCDSKADGTAGCSDGDACTQTDTCQNQVCVGSNPRTCTASDQCHDIGTCAPATGLCSNPAKPNGATCTDGNACTTTDTCQAGVCAAGIAVACTAQDQCHDVGVCAPATGVCSSPAKANGTTCNDANACTAADTCQAGVCTGGNATTCTAQDSCHTAGTCDPATGTCSNPIAGSCTGVVVTVLDTTRQPRLGALVTAYRANVASGSATTDATGQASLALPAGAYSFRTVFMGLNFVSSATDNCLVPDCTAAQIEVPKDPVVVTVVDTSGALQPDALVTARDHNHGNKGSLKTNAQGQATYWLTSDSSYSFEVNWHGVIFTSQTTPSCVVPGCVAVQVQVPKDPVVVTVVDTTGAIQQSVLVTARDHNHGNKGTLTTNAQGQVTYWLLADTSYSFEANWHGVIFTSLTTPSCVVPGCLAVQVQVPKDPVTVTVVDTINAPQQDVLVTARDAMHVSRGGGRTDAQGQVIFWLLANSPYTFEANWNGTIFASASCAVPGCTPRMIFVPVSCVGLPDGTSCSDANACNGDETCRAGVCTAGTAPVVDDLNLCTTDSCDPLTGVHHLPNQMQEGLTCGGTGCQSSVCQMGACIADPARPPLCSVEPTVSCVSQQTDGSYQAIFGYTNQSARNVYGAPAAPDNFVSPAPANRGQPSWFKGATSTEPSQPVAFVTSFTPPATVTWTVGGRSAVASAALASTLSCPTNPNGRDGPEVTIGGKVYPVSFDRARILSASIDRAGEAISPGGLTAAGESSGGLDVTGDGAATYSLPIKVPSGRAGVEPSLSLEYHSRGGSDLLGVGWRLAGLAEIAPCQKNLRTDIEVAPVKYDSSDSLCFNGARLIAVTGSPSFTHTDGREFRTERDSGARIISHDDADGAAQWFEVHLRSGRIMKFGAFPGYSGPNAQILGRANRFTVTESTPPGGGTPVVTRQWGPTPVVISWPLTEVRDRFGNAMRVDYDVDQRAQSYEDNPAWIFYTESSTRPPRRLVQFVYENRTSSDTTERFFSGVRLMSSKRLNKIVAAAPSPTATSPVRYYSMSYDTSPVSGRSLLTSVKECEPGADGVGTNDVCLSPTSFEYDKGHLETGLSGALFRQVRSNLAGPHSGGDYGDSNLDVADINGDGKDDVIFPSGNGQRVTEATVSRPISFSLSNAPNESTPYAGTITTPAGSGIMGATPSPLSFHIRAYPRDLDGDGKAELIDPACYYAFNESLFPICRPVVYDFNGSGYQLAPYLTDGFLNDRITNATDVVVADVNGDGLSELIFPSDFVPSGSYSWSIREAIPGPAKAFRARVPLLDLDPIGLGLIARPLEPTRASTLPRSDLLLYGHRNFLVPSITPGQRLNGHSTTRLTGLGQPPGSDLAAQQAFVDVNGDGLPEFIQGVALTTSDGPFFVNTGNGFDGPFSSPLPARPEPAFFRQIDVNGDGRPDLLFPALDDGSGMRVLQSNGTGFVTVGSGIPRGRIANGDLNSRAVIACRDPDPNCDPSDPNSTCGFFEVPDAMLSCVRGPNAPCTVGSAGEHKTWECQCAQGDPHGDCIIRPSEEESAHFTTQVLDWNGDGLSDIATVGRDGATLDIWVHNGKKPDVLKKVTRGMGATVEVEYSPVSDSTVYTPVATTYPLRSLRAGMWVVSKVSRDRGLSDTTSKDVYSYSYRDGRSDLRGRGWLGFAERTRTRAVAGGPGNVGFTERVVTSFERAFEESSDQFAYGMSPTTEETTVIAPGSRSHGVRRIFSYDNTPVRGVAGASASENQRVYHVNLLTVDETEYDNDLSNPLLDTESKRHTTRAKVYDSYGNLTVDQEIIQWRPGRGQAVQSASTFQGWTFDEPETTFTERRFLGRALTQTTDSTYNQDQNVESRQLRFDWDANFALLKTTVQPGKQGDVELMTSIDARSPEGLPRVVTVKDTSNHARVTTTDYDDLEGIYPAQITNAAGHVATMVYSPGFDSVVWQRDPNGRITRTILDGFGRVRTGDGPASADTSTTYTASSTSPLVVTTSSLDGRQRSIVEADRLGRQIKSSATTFAGGLATTTTMYNDLGLAATITRPYGSTTLTYDELGRVRLATSDDESAAGGSAVVDTRYEDYFKVRTTDPRGNETYAISDPLGNLREKVEVAIPACSASNPPAPDCTSSGKELHTSYGYRAFNLLSTVTSGSSGAVTTYDYDVLGRQLSVRSPESGLQRVSYTPFGELRERSDDEGRVATLEYDSVGRLRRRVDTKGSVTRETLFEYDSAPNGIGLLATSRSPDGVRTAAAYEAVFGLPSVQDQYVAGQNSEQPFSLETTYDQFGRVDRTTYPADGGGRPRFATRNLYRADSGALSSVVNAADGSVYWKGTARDPLGRIAAEELADGQMVSSRTYLPRSGRLDSLRTLNGPTVLQDAHYDYQSDGNLAFRQDRVNSVNEGFAYDRLDRLTRWYATNASNADISGSAWNVAWGYDDEGNLTSRTATSTFGSQSVTSTYASSVPHRLTGSSLWSGTFAYDGVGNLTGHPAGGTTAYTPFNLPSAVSGGPQPMRYLYDAAGGRAMKQSTDSNGNPTSTVRTVYVGGLYERRIDGAGDSHIFYIASPDRVVAQVRRAGSAADIVTYVYGDRQQSTEVTIIPGQPPATTKLDPFGNKVAMASGLLDVRVRTTAPGPASPAEVGRGFTGHEMDDELGLINMGGRTYDPRVARFLQPDPLVSQPGRSQGWNRYSYGMNNPVRYTDPTGHSSVADEAAGHELTQEQYCQIMQLQCSQDDTHFVYERIAEEGAAEHIDWAREASTAHRALMAERAEAERISNYPALAFADPTGQVSLALYSLSPEEQKTLVIGVGIAFGVAAALFLAPEVLAFAAAHPRVVAQANQMLVEMSSGVPTVAAGAATGAPKLLTQFAESTVDDVVASAGRLRLGGQISEGARAIAKKLGHAESEGFPSAFAGVNPTQANAEAIIRGAMANPAHTFYGDKVIDVYNAAGQGVRFDRATSAFKGFLERGISTQ